VFSLSFLENKYSMPILALFHVEKSNGIPFEKLMYYKFSDKHKTLQEMEVLDSSFSMLYS